MKKLVQIVSYYNPPHVGGMEIRARERAERLAEAGWTVETITSSEQTHPHTVARGSVVVRYLKSWEIARTPILFSLPIALLRIPKDSVVQVETAIAYVPEVTALMCKLRGMPYIARMPLDSTGHSGVRVLLLTWYQKTVLRWVFKNAARVIVLTEDDASLAIQKYEVDPRRIRIIPNGTDFAQMTSPRTSFGDQFRLLFVGRVAMQKNVPLLLESLRHFIDVYSSAIRLDLVGDGEDMQRVRMLITELSLQDHVTLKGYVTGSDLEQLFEQADALVLSSTRETFPQVILEAMSKGLPVVAGNIRSIRTVVTDGDTGLLVDLAKESLADAFHRLMTQDGLYERLSAGSLERAKSYSWGATIAAYTTLYDELVDGLTAPCGDSRRRPAASGEAQQS